MGFGDVQQVDASLTFADHSSSTSYAVGGEQAEQQLLLTRQLCCGEKYSAFTDQVDGVTARPCFKRIMRIGHPRTER